MTVVSLFPSATEIAAELGAVPAAVSHQCDHPPAVRDRPTITGLVRDLDRDPADIDRIVAFDDVYWLDGEILAEVDPDVVLTQGVCAVCALDAGLAHEAVDRLGLDADVLDVHADDLGDVLDNVDRIGEAVGQPDAATELRADLDARIERVRDRTAAPERSDTTSTGDADRPRVAVLDWTDPIRHAGLWVPELITAAGGECGLAEPGERSGRIEPEELRSFDPEVLVVAPCSYELDESTAAAESLLDRVDLAGLTAVRNDRVYAMDGSAYFNRHSHRVVDSMEALARVVHPERFDEGESTEMAEDHVRRIDVAPA